VTTDRRRLLQRLAFSESRHFSWDMLPANTMAYDRCRHGGQCSRHSQVEEEEKNDLEVSEEEQMRDGETAADVADNAADTARYGMVSITIKG